MAAERLFTAREVALIVDHFGGDGAAFSAHVDADDWDVLNVGVEARHEYIVSGAPGYPDPYSVWPPTEDEAIKFARDHDRNAVTGERVKPTIRHRLVTAWAVVDYDMDLVALGEGRRPDGDPA